MEKFKVGIIGAGDIAQEHLKVLHDFDDVEILAICNRGEERRLQTAKQFNIPHVYANYEDMYVNHKLDAVFILVTIEHMEKVCTDCAKKGVPLLVEKPPALSLEGVQKIRDISKEHNTLMMVALNRRFISTIVKAKELVGTLNGINIEAPERYLNEVEERTNSKEAMEAWIYANGIHCIDLLRFFGGDVKDVVSLSNNQQHVYNAQIEFENCFGQYRSYWDSPGGWTVVLYGDQKKVRLFPLEKGVISVRGKKPEEFELDELDKRYKPGFYRQARYFFDCIKEKKPFSYPASDIDDCVKTMDLIKNIEK